MSLMSICWTLFKSASIGNSFDLGFILSKGDLLFKSLNNYRYLGMEELPQKFFFENSSINSEFANNRIREITAGSYLVCIIEIQSQEDSVKTKLSVYS